MTSVDLIQGYTYHGRKGAVQNAFRYTVDYVVLDAERKPKAPRLFGRNRFGLLSVRDTDHGGPPGEGIGAVWAREVLARYGIQSAGPLLLLTQPRLLGHVFNPVSFWLAHNGEGALIAAIAEVTNTFGDRHSYLCAKPDQTPITASDRMKSIKLMHVSPFQKVDGGYEFRFDITDQRIGIWIDYSGGEGGVIATLCGPRRPMRTSGMLYSALRRPFGARRVLALIHWQALKLWWKGALYRPRPTPPAQDVSQ